ncbi:hypothetical protein DFH27DRAFT_536316 [Peziza echinospora]|nr:hypothetical protein DFH27DRAFT_536316 [Peziza echinospora]
MDVRGLEVGAAWDHFIMRNAGAMGLEFFLLLFFFCLPCAFPFWLCFFIVFFIFMLYLPTYGYSYLVPVLALQLAIFITARSSCGNH